MSLQTMTQPHAFDATPPSPIVPEPSLVQNLERSVASYGFGGMPHVIRPEVLRTIQEEAEAKLGEAVLAEQFTGLRYRARIASLGDEAKGLLVNPHMLDLLERVFNERFELSEQISCLTCYGSGDHLGAHLDKPASDCAVTIIIYLFGSSPDPDAPDTGLVLNVYGESEDSVGNARLRIPTKAGTVVLGRGSRVWHERPRLKEGEEVIAITGCYKPAS